MLSEISQIEEDKYSMISLTCGIKKIELVNITKNKQIHRYREQTSGYQWEEGRGEGQYRERGLRGIKYYV